MQQIKVKDTKMHKVITQSDVILKNNSIKDIYHEILVAEGKLVLIELDYTHITPNSLYRDDHDNICFCNDLILTRGWSNKKQSEVLSISYTKYKTITPIIISETEKIEVGDWFYWGGTTPQIQQSVHGSEPTDIVKKILALPEHFSPKHLQDNGDSKLKDGDKVLVECKETIATVTKDTVLGLVYKMYPNEPKDNCFARESKKGDWEVGYTNDYPLQHGNGIKFICPIEVINTLVKAERLKDNIIKLNQSNHITLHKVEVSKEREILTHFVREIQKEFKNENLEYLNFIIDRVLNNKVEEKMYTREELPFKQIGEVLKYLEDQSVYDKMGKWNDPYYKLKKWFEQNVK